MKNLAIKGHETRGKEVIEILKMLGGKTYRVLTGELICHAYYIKSNGFIDYKHRSEFNNDIVYSLEEFLEKYPYKIGDRVSSKYLKNYKIEKAEWGSCNNRVIYKLQGMGWYSVEELQPYKEETMDKVSKAVFDVNALCCDIMNHLIKEETMQEQIMTEDITLEKSVMCTFSEVVEGKQRLRIAMNEGFELKEENGNFFVYRKKVGYPKTYEECCKTLNIPSNGNIAYVGNWVYGGEYLEKHLNRLRNFQQLLICRDAYWKMVGEQMGLGRPWHQDYNDRCFIIANNKDNVHTYEYHGKDNIILSFPTAEMRDVFYENFKELIESCKELL